MDFRLERTARKTDAGGVLALAQVEVLDVNCQMTAVSPKRSWRGTAKLVRADLRDASVE